MNNNLLEILIMLIGGGGGLFALIRYLVSEHNKMQKNFLSHLEIKNNHLEKATEEFNKTTNRFHEVIKELTIEIKNNNTAHETIIMNLASKKGRKIKAT